MSLSSNAATALVEPAAPVAEGEAAAKIEGKSPWRLGFERLRRDRAAMISLGIIVAIVLSLPTAGPLLLQSLMSQDMYLAGAFVLLICALTLIGSLISDILLALVDPRIRLE